MVIKPGLSEGRKREHSHSQQRDERLKSTPRIPYSRGVLKIIHNLKATRPKRAEVRWCKERFAARPITYGLGTH